MIRRGFPRGAPRENPPFSSFHYFDNRDVGEGERVSSINAARNVLFPFKTACDPSQCEYGTPFEAFSTKVFSGDLRYDLGNSPRRIRTQKDDQALFDASGQRKQILYAQGILRNPSLLNCTLRAATVIEAPIKDSSNE